VVALAFGWLSTTWYSPVYTFALVLDRVAKPYLINKLSPPPSQPKKIVPIGRGAKAKNLASIVKLNYCLG
jgi:hypothetical protein